MRGSRKGTDRNEGKACEGGRRVDCLRREGAFCHRAGPLIGRVVRRRQSHGKVAVGRVDRAWPRQEDLLVREG